MKLEKTVMMLREKGIWNRLKLSHRFAEMAVFRKTGYVDENISLDAFKKILIYETERNDDLLRTMAKEVSEQIFDQLSRQILQEIRQGKNGNE